MEIRVGNVVQRINCDNPDLKAGDYGVVSEIADFTYVKINKTDNNHDRNNLRLIHDIAIGDRVKRIGNNLYDVREGETYTIRDIRVNRHTGKVDIDLELGDNGQFWYKYDKFEKVEGVKIMKTEEKTDEQIRQELIEELKDFDTRNIDNDLENIDYEIKRTKTRIRNAISNVNEQYKYLKEYMLEREKKKLEYKEKDFTHDVNALYNHPSVKQVNLYKSDKWIEVITDYIDIYDEDGNRYAGGNYRLVFDYSDMGVRIHGIDDDYCNQGYWTEYDPHPHVDGDGGWPCLGNAGSMLCQSMNEMELYASFIIVFNFLQQVNTDDCAGKYIENWNCIDGEGNVITNPHIRERYKCNQCSYETMDRDDIYMCEICGEYVCYDHKMWISNEGIYVCESCCEEHFEHCKACGGRHRKDSLTEVDGEKYCEDCLDENFVTCDECSTLTDREDIETVSGDNKFLDLCPKCLEKLTITCEKCDEIVLRENAKEKLGEYYCESCYDEIFEEEEPTETEVLKEIVKDAILEKMVIDIQVKEEEATNED